MSWLAEFHSRLGYHPDRVLAPGAEISSGSLGHGLGLAVGTALGLGITGHHASRVVVLTAVVIDNDSSSFGWPGGVAARFAVTGWATADVDGRDHGALRRALRPQHVGQPSAVIAHVEEEAA